ncbi:parathyroid hormone 1b [Anarhichas minor]|uniref:parathyroid hormone 1b n=1 Tax=Anarhichas minor TaxID=65739 RepID=UPI003F73DF7B
MFSLRYLETLVLIVFFASLHLEAKPLRKRTISEVQLMHNVREHKQVGDRQDWLQERLKDITVASAKPQHGQSANTKNNFPNDVLGSNMHKS